MEILLIILAVLLAACAVVGVFFYRAFLYNKPVEPNRSQSAPPQYLDGVQPTPYRAQMQADWAALRARPYEKVTITADDGTELFGRYYHHRDGAPLLLGFHGYKGTSLRDNMGGAQIAQALGYNMLLPDQRAHGLSGGHTITLGIKERYDCLAWANYAARRFGSETPILLMGISMGAATVLLATGLALPANVRGVIADCGFTSPRAIARKCIRQWFHIPPDPLYLIGRLAVRLLGGVDLDDKAADCRTALAGSRLPLLLIHGAADDFVPCEMSRENFAASAADPDDKQLLLIAGAPHAMAYYFDTPAYTRAVTDFCTRVLAGGV